MKKYKLIKEYPGSPKLGTILTLDVKEGDYGIDVNNLNIFRHRNEIENQFEYWQEVVEKEYEILTMKCKWSSPQHSPGDIIKHQPDYLCYQYSDSCFDIHSVKRLSDGEIFTVGDYVSITAITNPCCETTIIQNLEFWLKEINRLKHIKKPLFTTEDGVDIFEGDEYFKNNEYGMECLGVHVQCCQCGLTRIITDKNQNKQPSWVKRRIEILKAKDEWFL